MAVTSTETARTRTNDHGRRHGFTTGTKDGRRATASTIFRCTRAAITHHRGLNIPRRRGHSICRTRFAATSFERSCTKPSPRQHNAWSDWVPFVSFKPTHVRRVPISCYRIKSKRFSLYENGYDQRSWNWPVNCCGSGIPLEIDMGPTIGGP